MKTHILAATLVAALMAGINPAHAGEPAEAPGTRTDAAPKQEIRLERVTPEYKTLPGWCQSTYGVKDGAKLPKAAEEYMRFISDFLQVEIGMISTGPERDATIVPEGTLLSRWL